MLEGYYDADVDTASKQRIIAVQAALELIKATLSDVNDGNGIAYQLETAEKRIKTLADAIQSAIEVR